MRATQATAPDVGLVYHTCLMCERKIKAPWGRTPDGWVCSKVCQDKYDREHAYISTEPD